MALVEFMEMVDIQRCDVEQPSFVKSQVACALELLDKRLKAAQAGQRVRYKPVSRLGVWLTSIMASTW